MYPKFLVNGSLYKLFKKWNVLKAPRTYYRRQGKKANLKIAISGNRKLRFFTNLEIAISGNRKLRFFKQLCFCN